MSKLHHAYFGQLDTDALDRNPDVVWERPFTLNGASFEVWLWAYPGMQLDADMLDAFAALLVDLPALDARVRQHLTGYLEKDRSYIEDHVEELADVPKIEALAPDGDASAVDAGAFAAAMDLRMIGLWPDVPGAPVVMDYMIDEERSDEILAVKLTGDGQLVSIDWES